MSGRRPGCRGTSPAGSETLHPSPDREPHSESGFLAPLTCRPCVLPRVGVALRVGLLDSFHLPPACLFPELSATVYPRSSSASGWTCLGPAAPAACPPHAPNRRESESFAALRSFKLRTCCVARDRDLRSPSLLPHFFGTSGWVSSAGGSCKQLPGGWFP